ncbi:MAG: hypothetical protein ACLTSX_01230 [Collinsella sp.]
MFYTLTANPAVDMTVAGPTLVPDENVRANSASYTANGKGLDVSFALKKFGVDSVALGFFGGFTGKFIVEETMNLGCLCRPVWIDGVTRICAYINDGEHEYGVLNPGAPLTPQYEEELYNILDTSTGMDCLVVSRFRCLRVPQGLPRPGHGSRSGPRRRRCAGPLLRQAQDASPPEAAAHQAEPPRDARDLRRSGEHR